MTTYKAPLEDIRFVIKELIGLEKLNQLPGLEGATEDIVDPVLDEAAKLASEVLAPINSEGDQHGSEVKDKSVVSAPGFAEAYQQYSEGGWSAIAGDPDFGGMGLPETIASAIAEMWQGSNLAFSLCPLLTQGAIDAIHQHGSQELKEKYLPKMISGEWTGTMNLTEPQAGSDLAAVASKAVLEKDHFRISGTKIFITWGDQEFTENIIHLVLARLPDAPAGVKGISLFLVPKYLVDVNGDKGARNDVYATSVEHKLGIHASPTCVMNFGDNEGAIGYLVGPPNNGLACMFTMMNHARLSVGVQGLGIAEAAYQQALAYAKERMQGGMPGNSGRVAIIKHPDVRRMLMLMKSQIEAMRAVAYTTIAHLDIAHCAESEHERANADVRVGLLTPIVKGWLTEAAQEIASLNIQIHGGMGFVEETGAAQLYRDARILPIYEGTTGIQALDLVGRKILRDSGAGITSLISDMKSTLSELNGLGKSLSDIAESLQYAIDHLEKAIAWLAGSVRENPAEAGACGVNLLMMMGVCCGSWQMARSTLAAKVKLETDDGDPRFLNSKLTTTCFFNQHVLTRASGYLASIVGGSDSMMVLAEDAF